MWAVRFWHSLEINSQGELRPPLRALALASGWSLAGLGMSFAVLHMPKGPRE